MSEKLIIRGGFVMTMDPALGDLPVGDLLISDGRIEAIGTELETSDAAVIDARHQLVLPGFVDTHRHTWQTQLRGLCADWTLTDYFNGIRTVISPSYRADDLRLGNYLGALEALNSGVTTLLDFSHCMNSPEHADAAVEGLRAARIRAVLCYGYFGSILLRDGFSGFDERRGDFERVARELESDDLLSAGVAATEVGLIPWSQTREELLSARHVGALTAFHTGCVWGSRATGGVRELAHEDLLGPDQVHIHCNTLEPEEWLLLGRAGCKVSTSPETELNMGMGALAISRCIEHGIEPTLSCDIVSLNSGDMFAQMRLAVAYERFRANDLINQAGGMPERLATTAADAISWATINGARACGLGHIVGSLTPGKFADVIVIGHPDSFTTAPRLDPAGTVVFQCNARDVDRVFVRGVEVKRDGALVGVDVRKLLHEAEQSARAILGRAKQLAPAMPPPPIASTDQIEAMIDANLKT